MNVIARNNGPDCNGIPNTGHLTQGKQYTILAISKPGQVGWTTIKENQTIKIPDFGKHKEYFYVNVIADDNQKRTYWCDYFLSTTEMRTLKLKKLNEY